MDDLQKQVDALGLELQVRLLANQEALRALDDRVRSVNDKIDEISDALSGSRLHPDGLTGRLSSLESDVHALRTDWDAWRNQAKGVVLALSFMAAVVGGAVAAGVNAILG